MAKVSCNNCTATTDVPDLYLGRKIKCPQCRTEFTAVRQPKPPPKASAVSPAASGKSAPTTTVKERIARAVGSLVALLILGAAYVLFDQFTNTSTNGSKPTPSPSVPDTDQQPVQHHQTVQEMIDDDPVVSRLAQMDGRISVQIRRGEYPSDVIQMLLLTGKMTMPQADHVRNFCGQIRDRHD